MRDCNLIAFEWSAVASTLEVCGRTVIKVESKASELRVSLVDNLGVFLVDGHATRRTAS